MTSLEPASSRPAGRSSAPSSSDRKSDPAKKPEAARTYQTEPLNRDIPRIFVAATRQNEGKTTTCLGLYGALRRYFPRLGYIKPIGQRFIDIDGLKIDEDSHLLNSIYQVGVPIEAMSPVAIDGTFTRRYLDDPETIRPQLIDRIVRAFDRATYEKEAILIEGSGHAGVGAVCDLSNAEVAKLLGAQAIIVSSGGIGKPIDEIALNKSLFDRHGVQVVGAILNKVLPDKRNLLQHYATRGLDRLGIPLLGMLPSIEQLAAPNLAQIVEEVDGRWLNARAQGRHERIRQVVIGAMGAKGVMDHFTEGTLIITPGDRDDILLSALAAAGTSQMKVVSGIILTRDVLPHPKLMGMLAQTPLPLVITRAESYDVASRIHSMTVKTQPEDTDKIPLIQDLVNQHVDIPRILSRLSGSS